MTLAEIDYKTTVLMYRTSHPLSTHTAVAKLIKTDHWDITMLNANGRVIDQQLGLNRAEAAMRSRAWVASGIPKPSAKPATKYIDRRRLAHTKDTP